MSAFEWLMVLGVAALDVAVLWVGMQLEQVIRLARNDQALQRERERRL